MKYELYMGLLTDFLLCLAPSSLQFHRKDKGAEGEDVPDKAMDCRVKDKVEGNAVSYILLVIAFPASMPLLLFCALFFTHPWKSVWCKLHYCTTYGLLRPIF